MNEIKGKKILYAASTESHLKRFHLPYIEELRRENEVCLMANGDRVDYPIAFQKNMFSLKNIKAIFSIRKILKRENFDVLILHTTLAAFFIRVAMFGWRKRPYVMNVVHGYLFNKHLHGKKDKLLLLCERMTAKKTDEIAVMNAEDIEIARENKLCLGSVHFIRGMGYRIKRDEIDTSVNIREQLEIPADCKVLTFVGELSARKNQIFLIRAMKKLREEGVCACLLLAGEGSERENYEKEIQELGLGNCVLMLGNREPITPYLAATDLYVSASRIEGLPFNVMEAMSCGLPIVATDTKGQNDLLKISHPQSLYPLDNMDVFCEKVKAVLLEDHLGVGIVEYPLLEQYSFESVFNENINLMKGMLK